MRGSRLSLAIFLASLIFLFSGSAFAAASYNEELVPVVYYERINDSGTFLHTTIAHFREQLDYLEASGYTTITFADLANHMRTGTKPPAKSVVLTFDVLTDFYQNAYPELKSRGMKATLYVVTGRVGGPGNPTEAQLLEMQSNGIEIGSHSTSHANCQSPGYNITYEIKGSYDYLKSIGIDVKSFAYPNGCFTSSIKNYVKKVGFLGARGIHKPGSLEGWRDPREAWLYDSVYAPWLFYSVYASPAREGVDFAGKVTYTGRNEIEEMYNVLSSTKGIPKVNYNLDSFSHVQTSTPGDKFRVSISIPESGNYDIISRVRTGFFMSAPSSMGTRYKYYIDGTAKTSQTLSTGFVQETRVSNGVWGFQKISNVSLAQGIHTITFEHGAGLSGLWWDYFEITSVG